MTPKACISRIFAFNQVFFYLGGVVGPMTGSAVAGQYGYHSVFYATAVCVAFSCLCNLVQFRSLLKSKGNLVRVKINLKCSSCGSMNYLTSKNSKTHPDKIEVLKILSKGKKSNFTS